MKLLFIIPEYPPHTGGGIATFYRNILPELAKQGHQVHVLVGSAFTSKLDSYNADGVTVEFLDSDLVTNNLSQFDRYHATPELQRHLAAAWTAREQVQSKSYDLVETTDWGLLFVPWVVEADSPPTVVQLHGSVGQINFYDPRRGDELQGNLIRLLEIGLLSTADELQTYSQLNSQAWSQLTNRKVVHISPGWCPRSNLEQLGEKSANGLVVGRIQYWKGPTVLCEALRLLGDSAPTIAWVGRDTAYQDNISMSSYLAQTYPDVWGVKIHPIGPRFLEETVKLQAKANFIIVPSLWDVFNYTCVEGMGYAQEVVCSQGAGAASLIADKFNGLTFASGSSEALAESINYLQCMGADERSQMGKAAQQTVQTKLDPSFIARQRIAAYAKLIKVGKSIVRPNPWLIEAVSPGKSLQQPLAFLEHLPLRELGTYVLHRSLRKIVA